MRTKLSDKAKKALASKPSYEALEQRVKELEKIVLQLMFPKDWKDEFLTGQQAKLVSEIHKEALKQTLPPADKEEVCDDDCSHCHGANGINH